MIEYFQDLGGSFRQFIAVLSFHLPRVSSFMLFFPLFNQGMASTFIKLAIANTLILYPAFSMLRTYESPGAQPVMNVITFMSEVALGGLLGLSIALPYYAFRAFGALIDVYRGATFSAQVTGNDSGEQLPLENLFGLMFTALILAGPGLHAITSQLLQSFLLLPPGTIGIQFIDTWGHVLLRLVVDHVLFAILLSAPVLIVVLVLEVIMEILSAFTPQLQVYNLAFGLRSVLGIGMTLLLVEYAEFEIFSLFKTYTDTLQTLTDKLT